MRAAQVMNGLIGWKWLPFAGLVGGTLTYVLLAVLLIPSDFGKTPIPRTAGPAAISRPGSLAESNSDDSLDLGASASERPRPRYTPRSSPRPSPPPRPQPPARTPAIIQPPPPPPPPPAAAPPAPDEEEEYEEEEAEEVNVEEVIRTPAASIRPKILGVPMRAVQTTGDDEPDPGDDEVDEDGDDQEDDAPAE